MGARGIRAADPTPAEIEERTAIIRNGWSKKDVRLRSVDAPEPYRVPVLSPSALSIKRPIVKLSGY